MKIINLFFFMIITSFIFEVNAQNYNSTIAAIETPEMQVFYEGIPFELNVQAIGEYRDLELNIPNPYTAPVGSAGERIIVKCTGINKKGDRVSLEGQKIFYVKKAPTPELIWNGKASGEMANLMSGALMVRYYGAPFNTYVNLDVDRYSISISGIKGVIKGEGAQIDDVFLKILRVLPEGSIVNVEVQYSGNNSGITKGSFKL